VGDIRGRGLFLALELVRERDSKTPFAPELKLHAAIKARAMANGLLVYPMGGTIDGRLGDHVLLAPPFVVTQGDLCEIVGRLKASMDAALKLVR
jgi:adenosylmethionine-8-amino-7-oxononanoate aminotransferase